MIYEKLEAIEKLAIQLHQLVTELKQENGLLKNTIQQLRSKNLTQAIEIADLNERLAKAQSSIGKSNIYSLTTIKQQGTEGVAHASSNATETPSKPKTKVLEAEKPQKAVRKPRKARSIDLLAPEETHSAVVYEAEAVG